MIGGDSSIILKRGEPFEDFGSEGLLTRRIGTLFGQRSQLWFELTPRQSYRMLAAIYGLDRQREHARIGELADYHVPTVEDVVSVGDEIMVVVTEIDRQGRVNLSRKAAMQRHLAKDPA